MLSDLVIGFRNLEAGISKRHKECMLIRFLQSRGEAWPHLIKWPALFCVLGDCPDSRHVWNHMSESLGISPTLLITHEKTKFSEAKTADHWVAWVKWATQLPRTDPQLPGWIVTKS